MGRGKKYQPEQGEREAETSGDESKLGQPCVEGLCLRKLLSPERRRIGKRKPVTSKGKANLLLKRNIRCR